MTDDDDHIDKTQWLPDKEEVLLPQRILKGDLDYGYSASGRLRFAHAHLRTVINFLADEEAINAYCRANTMETRSSVLDYPHVHAGQTYEILQAGFCSKLGLRNSSIYFSEVRSALISEGLKEEDYGIIVRRMTGHDKKLIETALYQHATEFACGMVLRHAGLYRAAFERLIDLLRDIKEKRDAERNACGIS